MAPYETPTAMGENWNSIREVSSLGRKRIDPFHESGRIPVVSARIIPARRPLKSRNTSSTVRGLYPGSIRRGGLPDSSTAGAGEDLVPFYSRAEEGLKEEREREAERTRDVGLRLKWIGEAGTCPCGGPYGPWNWTLPVLSFILFSVYYSLYV